MSKKTITLCVALILALTLGLGGTLAYLTDTDGDINVMTVGYVTIVQNEQERVEIGNAAEKGLQEFTQGKPMNPAVFKDYSAKEAVDANGWEVEIRDEVRNYVDKIVSVTNTSINDAYVRTIYAFPEMGDFDTTYNAAEQWFHWNGVSDTDTDPDNGWIWGKDKVTEWPGNTDNWDVYENVELTIDGETKTYDIYIATNKNVQKSGATTAPSLLGMFLDPRVDCKVAADGSLNYTFTDAEGKVYNLGDISKLEVLALSQAVQADGFDNAWEAFEAAFPTNVENLQTWLSDMEVGSPGDKWPNNNVPDYLYNGPDVHNSSNKNGFFVLGNNIKTSDSEVRYGYGYEYIVRGGVDYTLDLNGRTIDFDTVNENANHNAFTYLFVANNAGTKLTLEGDGNIYCNNSEGYTCAVQGKDGTLTTINGGDFEVDNGIAVWAGAGSHIVINDGSFVNGNATTDHELIYSSGGVIDIYGGFFHNTDGNYTLNVEDRNRGTGFINVYGGTYVNFDPSTGGQDPENIKVADGYKVVSETQENGDVWYTVVPE